MTSIPASQIVAVTPQVLSAGGSGLDLNSLILTQNTRIPIGTVPSFPTQPSVESYFGPASQEAVLSQTYFNGFNNSNIKPGALLFTQCPAVAVSAYIRGGSVAALSLTALKALSGSLTVTIDGTTKTTVSVSLSSATSFSNAAALLGTAMLISGQVTYDSVASAFVITSLTTDVTSTVTFATGTIAAALGLTQAVGAVLSQGAPAGTPGTSMSAIVTQTTNWAVFLTTWEPSTADKVSFAAWNSAQGNRYLYAAWDTDITATQTGGTTSAGYLIKAAAYTGTALIYAPVNGATIATFLGGAIAALDFTETNGRATMAFRSLDGLAPDVTDAASAANLEANGYNFYGLYTTANDAFRFLYPGQVSGQFLWIDSYINQIWLNNQLQLALMVLLTTMKSIPYNIAGYSLISASCIDPIVAALNFGAIRPGVTLSSAQAAEVNFAAGLPIDQTLSSRGWFLQVLDAAPQIRAQRKSPPVTLWYLDGQSVQRIALASIEVQ